MLLVDLDLAERVRDIRRLEPPAPDVEILCTRAWTTMTRMGTNERAGLRTMSA